jgi:hypothetical protein
VTLSLQSLKVISQRLTLRLTPPWPSKDSIGANPGVGRADGVDLKASSDIPAGSGLVLGWRTAGEWTKYTITTQASNLTARVESGSTTGAFHVSVDNVTAGSHVIEVSVDSQWFDLNYLTFTEL